MIKNTMNTLLKLFRFPVQKIRKLQSGSGKVCSHADHNILCPDKKEKEKRWKDWGFFFICFLLLFCSFYHNSLATAFDLLPGDDGDTRFNLLIVEHWIQFFRGELSFGEARMFYPVNYGLGFSDLSLGVALLEWPLRVMGLDLYRATQMIYYLLHFSGAAACFYLLRKQLHLNLIPSLGGMMVICFGNSLYLKLIHTQFYSYFLLPLLLVLLIHYCRYPAETGFVKRQLTLAAAALSGLWILYTGFYTIFFAGFFTVVFGIFCLLTFLYRQDPKDFSAFRQWLKIRIPEILITFIFSLLALIPFLKIYLPVVRLGFRRTW